MNYILRIVPAGKPAVNWQDDDECDLDQPCDLVMLVEDADWEAEEWFEREVGREQYETGHAASRALCEMIKR